MDVSAKATMDCLAKKIPASAIAHAMYIIDSYPSLHGACVEIYQRNANPNVCTEKAIILIPSTAFVINVIGVFGLTIFANININNVQTA